MKENLRKLEEFEKQINFTTKLKFSKAQKIYTEMYEEINLERKQELRSQLIEGTLYVVYRAIKNSGILYLENSVIDIDDIINSFVEVWIKILDSGRILNVKGFSSLFTVVFYNELSSILVNNKITLYSDMKIDEISYSNLINLFFNSKNNAIDISYDEYLNFIKNEKIHREFTAHDYLIVYNLFNSIYDSCSSEDDFIDICKTNLLHLKNILLNNGVESLNIDVNLLSIKDISDRVVMNDFRNLFNDTVFSCDNLSDMEKQVLCEWYYEGLMSKEIGKKLNISRQRVEQLEDSALFKLRCTRKVRKLYRSYGGLE